MVLTRNNDEKDLIVSHLRANDIPTGTPEGGDVTDGDEHGSVTVKTVHKSKGTEARFVVVANAVDDEYGGMPTEPREKRGERPAIDETIDHYEEEPRLFYVALTRAEVDYTSSHDRTVFPDISTRSRRTSTSSTTRWTVSKGNSPT